MSFPFTLRSLCCTLLLAGLHSLLAHGQSARGQVKDGKPVGVWEYYDGPELGLRFNYDSSRIQSIRPDTARYLIRLDSAWQPQRLYRAPRVLGSRTDQLLFLQRQLRYPLQDIRAHATGTVVLTYVIDEQGRKTNPVVTTAPTKTLAEEVYRVAESLPFGYIPAIYQGRRVPSKIAFVVHFALCKNPATCQPTGYPTANPFGSQGEVIVTAFTD